jgi:hypothetical protein
LHATHSRLVVIVLGLLRARLRRRQLLLLLLIVVVVVVVVVVALRRALARRSIKHTALALLVTRLSLALLRRL